MEIVFTFHNSRSAVLGESSLLAAGVAARVMSLPSVLGSGCGFCLRVAAGDLKRASGVMAGAGIEPEGIYRKCVEGGRTFYLQV